MGGRVTLPQATESPVFTSVVAASPLAALDRWLNEAIPTQDTSPPDSVIMRNLAYDILRTWPRSRDKVGQYIGVNQPGSEEAIYGKQFLMSFYRAYQGQRRRLKARVFDGGTQYFEQQYAEWEKDWGPDLAVAPAQVPDDYVPEEFDGKWYLSVKLETRRLLYYACLEKNGHIFGRWDASNTRAWSHIASSAPVMISPYPVQMRFSLSRRWPAKRIRFSDDVLQAKGRTTWPKLTARPYRRPARRPPHVAYEFEYPIYDLESRRWFNAKAVLSSDPGPEYEEVQSTLEALEAQGQKGMATDLRSWAGDYRVSR